MLWDISIWKEDSLNIIIKKYSREKLMKQKKKIIGEYTDKINDMKKAKENFENLLNKIWKRKEKESVTEKLNDLTFIIKFSSLNNYDTNWPKYKNFSC